MKKLTKILTILIMVASFATAWAAPAEGSVAPNKKLYDFNFVNMDYEAIFRSVSVIAGVDILIAPDVKGKISLRVTKKTWQETLDIICNMNDLTWVIQDKYISIQRLSTDQAKQKKAVPVMRRLRPDRGVQRMSLPSSEMVDNKRLAQHMVATSCRDRRERIVDIVCLLVVPELHDERPHDSEPVPSCMLRRERQLKLLHS